MKEENFVVTDCTQQRLRTREWKIFENVGRWRGRREILILLTVVMNTAYLLAIRVIAEMFSCGEG
jgi:hypothetical protein